MAPTRRRKTSLGLDIPDEVRLAIENGIKLDQVLAGLTEVKGEQKVFNEIAIALREHKTIEKTDQNTTQLGRVQWLLTGILLLVPVLAATHTIWHWP